jgi:hypothetical protein
VTVQCQKALHPTFCADRQTTRSGIGECFKKWRKSTAFGGAFRSCLLAVE